MDNSTVEKIIKEIEQFKPSHESAHTGKVVSVVDGVVAIDGRSKVVMSEILIFEETKGKKIQSEIEAQGELYALVLLLTEHEVRGTILGETSRLLAGMTVKS